MAQSGELRTAGVLVAVAVVVGAAVLAADGPLPGDASLTRAVQDGLGASPAWARALTDTAKPPAAFALTAAVAAAGWAVGGVRNAAAAGLSFALAFAADKLLRLVMHVPKPDAALVAVDAPSASSGLPSTFALTYGALLGVLLLAPRTARRPAVDAVRLVAAALLAAGLLARVVLGGHWTSQMIASTAAGLALGGLALSLSDRLFATRRPRPA